MDDFAAYFAEQVRGAAAAKRPLRIRGSGSKDFYGGPLEGEVLDTRRHTGIVGYDPTELVITARCGTPLTEIEAALAGAGQMLAFEPPHFGDGATLGGAIATGLSGPRRVAAGSARDFVLGVKMMNGRAEVLNFGGQVMKNVAGYDVSRLMAGAMGCLGLLLEVSLKVLPLPATETTLRLEAPQGRALELLNGWAGRPLPISASCWEDDALMLRLSGANAAVAAARRQIGGERVADGAAFWRALREQQAAFFADELPLWRLSLPSVAAQLDLPGAQLLEWGGSLRWLKSGATPERIRAAATRAGGHATLFRGGEEDRADGAFQTLPSPLLALNRQLKRVFDPAGIFNPGRMIREF
ncbi:MAG TPA: glycolate oxidase subunit GlcE [Rhodocyclaceae bacterium]|nr:glycolate oxidase subunit GlcE [Rhodocyclaceae bacterium]